MKKFILFFIIFTFLGFANYTDADNTPTYFDSGFTVNNQKIWILNTPPYLREKNVCIENEKKQKDCLFSCYFCGENESDKTEKSLFPINNKGIFYIEDEFNLKYYDMESKKSVDVSDDIYKLLVQYQIDPDMSYYIMDDRRFSDFTDKNLSPDGMQFIVSIEYTDESASTIRTPLICIVNMDKLSAGKDNYLSCPIVTEKMRNTDVASIPENTWTDKNLPVFKGWTDENTIRVQTREGDDFVLSVAENTLQKLIRQILFSDIPLTHPLYGLTKLAKEQGWISGYPDGTFKPDKTVNRAEFAKMLTLAFNKGTGAGSNLEIFPDVRQGEWYIPYLSKAVELGIMAGYPDGKMKPGDTIIKAEALKMTLEIMKAAVGGTAEGEKWYEKYRRYAEEQFTSLTFLSPEDMGKQMTRGECIALIIGAKE